MKIRMLGTGTSQGVPVIACDCEVCTSTDPRDKRLRSSIQISEGDTNIVIDTGPDFRQQMLASGIKNLDAVVFTHEHKDHIAGLDDIRAFNFRQKKDMDVYATERVQEALKREFHYVFAPIRYPGIPQIALKTIDLTPFEINGIEFIPIEVMHHKLPVMAFRIGDFAYVTDANSIASAEFNKLRGVKTLVINALRKETHISHFNLEEALEIISIIKPERAYLTHISHLLGKHEDISKELPEGVELAYDGLEFTV
ncbi:MAG: MBL fold metallo-hydrolase [Flavobacteriales bacterium]|nr:MBL fold metallo-hydrolase [Flavobacteriales bacterium]